MGFLNVLLPTFDVYSDISVTMRFFIGSQRRPLCNEMYDENTEDRLSYHYKVAAHHESISNVTYTPHPTWGMMMLAPFLLNYGICWYVWSVTDKRKAVSWVAALLSLYPQYVACAIIQQICGNPKKGLQKKTCFERNLVQMESYYESIPSTYVLVKATGGPFKVPGQELIFNRFDRRDSILFSLVFITSVFTSILDLAKT